ncbi:MAG TPA: glycyl-radical enzyme activating protein [Candidatus Limnocylindria bacterium]|nr:glycyl-radical enzyme activating protein [Candidatus Limnocylindria bacterium]
MEGLTAVIADVQRSSVHDGPGFRTTVFFKGCQLRCAWCHNPETIAFEPEEIHYPEKCIGCAMCTQGCFSGARVVCGRVMTAADVMYEVAHDRPYYGAEGGVTLSGGEPLCQPAFAMSLLEACRDAGIGTAMESNMAAPWETAVPVLPLLDLLMADLKTWDEDTHRAWTGAGNQRIKDNLRRAAQMGVPLVLRTPVVPGVNATAGEIGAIAAFAATLPNLRYYELLSYHPLGLSKARAAGVGGTTFDIPGRGLMEELAEAALGACAAVRVNGVDAGRFLGRGDKWAR